MRSPAPGDAGLVGWQTAFRAAARASEGAAWKGPGGDTGHLCVPLAVHSLLWPPLQGSILHSGRNGAAREPASTRQRPPLAGRGPTGTPTTGKRPSLWTPDGTRVGSAGGCGEKWALVGPCGPAEGRPERLYWPASSLSPSFRGFVDGLRHRAQHRVLLSFLAVRLSLFFCPLLLRRPQLGYCR